MDKLLIIFCAIIFLSQSALGLQISPTEFAFGDVLLNQTYVQPISSDRLVEMYSECSEYIRVKLEDQQQYLTIDVPSYLEDGTHVCSVSVFEQNNSIAGIRTFVTFHVSRTQTLKLSVVSSMPLCDSLYCRWTPQLTNTGNVRLTPFVHFLGKTVLLDELLPGGTVAVHAVASRRYFSDGKHIVNVSICADSDCNLTLFDEKYEIVFPVQQNGISISNVSLVLGDDLVLFATMSTFEENLQGFFIVSGQSWYRKSVPVNIAANTTVRFVSVLERVDADFGDVFFIRGDTTQYQQRIAFTNATADKKTLAVVQSVQTDQGVSFSVKFWAIAAIVLGVCGFALARVWLSTKRTKKGDKYLNKDSY